MISLVYVVKKGLNFSDDFIDMIMGVKLIVLFVNGLFVGITVLEIINISPLT